MQTDEQLVQKMEQKQFKHFKTIQTIQSKLLPQMQLYLNAIFVVRNTSVVSYFVQHIEKSVFVGKDEITSK